MNTIGDRVKAVRSLRRLSQLDLSEKIGLSTPSISSIENNRSAPTETLLNLAKVLKVDPNWLIHGEGVTPEGIELHAISKTIEIPLQPWKEEAFRLLKEENERLWKLIEKLTGANFPKSPKIARAAKLGVLLGDHLGLAA